MLSERLLILTFTRVCVQVLNEVVVDRGPSSYLSNVDLYLDGRLITSVQGDGKSNTRLHLTSCFFSNCLSRSSKLKSLLSLSLSSRCDCVHTDRQHGVRGRSRSLHDSPQRTCHHGHPHLPTLPVLQAHRGACWGGAHGKSEGEEAG